MRKTKKLVAMLLILSMLMAVISFNVFAIDTTQYAEIQVNDATGILGSDGGNTKTIKFQNGTVTATGTDLQSETRNVDNGSENIVPLYFLGAKLNTQLVFQFNANEGYIAKLWVDGIEQQLNNNSYTIDSISNGNNFNFVFEQENSNPGGNQNNTYNINFGTATWTIDGVTVTASVEGKNLNNGSVTLGATELIKLNGFDSSKMQVVVRADDGFNTTLNVNENNETSLVNNNADGLLDTLTFVVEKKDDNTNHNPGGENNHSANATCTINYKVSGAIEYRDGSGMNPIGVDFMINNTNYRMNSSKATFSEGLAFEEEPDEKGNRVPIMVPGPNGMEQLKETNGVTISNDSITYGYDDTTNKVSFTFLTQWNTKITNININGQVINDLPQTREELISHYNNQRLEIVVNDIDKADEYNIEITARKQNENEIIMGNFLWDYNENGGYTSPDDKIAHATLKFVKATYNGTTITSIDKINELGGVYSWDNTERKKIYSDEWDGVGSATFPVGTELTLVLIPDTGYQLVEFLINEGAFKAEKEIGTYTFTVPGGNFHLAATFEQVDDVVNAKSDKVESGSITLGGTESSMNNGTARLDVDDITLSKTQISNFEKAAGDYTISNYLDISLYNTVYKGRVDSSWDTQVKDLDNPAKITLQLEDGIDGNEIVIVHEKHDGTYEIIETTYDATTNTISFVTSSFSNYAIASKIATANTDTENKNTDEENKNTDIEDKNTYTENKNTITDKTSNNPTTGDNIIIFVIIFVIATLGLFTTIIFNKNHKVRKH